MHRKKPFSHRQKKEQLKQKREKKNETEPKFVAPTQARLTEDTPVVDVMKVNEQPLPQTTGRSYNPNRYRLHFEQESKEDVEKRKQLARTVAIEPLPETVLEVAVEDIYKPGSVLDLPRRPAWDYHMTKTEVEKNEEAAFQQYLKNIYTQHCHEELSFFELNVETWRQLWRVLEISDVLLLITDVRHPVLHFSPALYKYVAEELKKHVVLVLNKIDLVPPEVVVAWRHYFLTKFPELDVICFTSYPKLEAGSCAKEVRLRSRGHKGKRRSAVGPEELFKVIESLYRDRVDLTNWGKKLESKNMRSTQSSVCNKASAVVEEEEEEDVEEEEEEEEGVEEDEEEEGVEEQGKEEEEKKDRKHPVSLHLAQEMEQVAPGVITIGLVGHPNVGKSSIINGIMGKKYVSVSRTPGHTKHFQTIFLTPTVRLCDCPGLIFPSLINRQLQVLCCMYPIAQVREPFTIVGYLAQRVPLVELLKLKHPGEEYEPKKEGEEVGVQATAKHVWTAWDICDAWAKQCGYLTAKAARPDSHRAANSILRLATDGKISMYFRPPSFSQEKAMWASHPEVQEITELQRLGLPPSAKEEATARQEDPATFIALDNKFSLLMDLDC